MSRRTGGPLFACASAALGTDASGRSQNPIEALLELEEAPLAPPPAHTARLAIETDFEFFQLFGNDVDARNYVADVVAFLSLVYEDEVDTSLAVSYLRTWGTAADPWNQGSTLCNLLGADINAGTAQLHQQLVFRPWTGLARPETFVPGLYLAGASAHPGGGVHGAPGANAFDGTNAVVNVRARLTEPLTNPGIAQSLTIVAKDLDGNDTNMTTNPFNLPANPVGADEYARRTGVVPVASFTATKLRWLRDAEPENAARVAAVALPHDWLTWRLRG